MTTEPTTDPIQTDIEDATFADIHDDNAFSIGDATFKKGQTAQETQEGGDLVEDEATTLRQAAEKERLLMYLDEAHQALPLFSHSPLPMDLSYEEAVDVVRSGIKTSVRSDATSTLKCEGVLLDAQEGRAVPVAVTVAYETRGSYMERRALMALLMALSHAPTTPTHVATTIGQLLWVLLSPGKLTVTVKPLSSGQVSEVGRFARKLDSENKGATFTLTEELIRLHLRLRVPALIAALHLKDGPEDTESEGAADAARELVVRIKNAPNEEELTLLAKLIAVAAFDKDGIHFTGLTFDAWDGYTRKEEVS